MVTYIPAVGNEVGARVRPGVLRDFIGGKRRHENDHDNSNRQAKHTPNDPSEVFVGLFHCLKISPAIIAQPRQR